MEIYLAGVSVRRVEDITEALWGTRVSPGTVSNLNKKIYAQIEAWRNRPIEGALARHGKPEIFNTDQGSQFTSLAFTRVLKDAGVRISMDGRGRWMDNVMIEGLWRSLKYECVYLQAFETGSEARAGIGSWIDYYNTGRPHSALDGPTPQEAYDGLTAPSSGHAPMRAEAQLAA
jgi:putative transposase